MKFLVIWELDLALLKNDLIKAVAHMPQYAEKVKKKGNLVARYHVVGKHGGAWIYEVNSNEELERVLALSPVYNYAQFNVYPLADMDSPADIINPPY